MAWVMDDAQELTTGLFATLICLANHANEEGRGAYPSQATLARKARKTVRQVRSDLGELKARGLITEGDQRMVDHLPADKRPVVWDLVMTGGSPLPPGSPLPGGNLRRGGRKSATERAEAGFPSGRKPTAGKPSVEPTEEPSGEPSLPAQAPAETKTAKATRIPDNFAVTADMRDWADREVPDLIAAGRARTEHDKFLDYWRAAAGAHARKVDWVATWRNWMRKAAQDLRPDSIRPAGSAVSRRQADVDALLQRAAVRMGATQ